MKIVRGQSKLLCITYIEENNFDLNKISRSKRMIIEIFNLPISFRNGTETVSIMFSKPEKRANWEESFNEAKQKLGEYNQRFNTNGLM